MIAIVAISKQAWVSQYVSGDSLPSNLPLL